MSYIYICVCTKIKARCVSFYGEMQTSLIQLMSFVCIISYHLMSQDSPSYLCGSAHTMSSRYPVGPRKRMKGEDSSSTCSSSAHSTCARHLGDVSLAWSQQGGQPQIKNVCKAVRRVLHFLQWTIGWICHDIGRWQVAAGYKIDLFRTNNCWVLLIFGCVC